MELHELEYFTTIARLGNITHAAQQLYVSQPTLTKYLQRLEKELGLPLFERTGRRLLLTYAGERYLARAQEMLNIKRALDAELADIRREDAGEFRVGMPPVRCSFSLPVVLPEFRRLHPNVHIQILEDSSEALDQALCEGRVDMNFYNFSVPNPMLEYQILCRDAIYAVLPQGHPAGQFARWEGQELFLRLEHLKNETFLLQKRTQRQGQYLYDLMRRQQFIPQQIQETSNIRAAVSLAVNGYGVAFVSGGLLRHFSTLGEFDAYRLAGSHSLDFVAAWRRGSYLPGYTQDFIALMKSI